MARGPVQVPEAGPVLSEGVAHQVSQVMFPGWQDVQQGVVFAPEWSTWVSPSHQVELGPVTEHFRGLEYHRVGLLGGKPPL